MRIFIMSLLFLIQPPFSIANYEEKETCMLGSAYYSNDGYLTKEKCQDHFLKTLFDRKYLRESVPEQSRTKETIAYGCREMDRGLEITWGPYGDEDRVLPSIRCPLLRSAKFLDIEFPTDPDPYDPSNVKDLGWCMMGTYYGATNIAKNHCILTKQQCIDLIYKNIIKQKFFDRRKTIEKTCMEEQSDIGFSWRWGLKWIPIMTIKCSLWNDWLKKTEANDVGKGN